MQLCYFQFHFTKIEGVNNGPPKTHRRDSPSRQQSLERKANSDVFDEPRTRVHRWYQAPVL